jgi:hypothetical protein
LSSNHKMLGGLSMRDPQGSPAIWLGQTSRIPMESNFCI